MQYIGKPELRGIEGFEDLCKKTQKSYEYLTYSFPIPEISIPEDNVVYITGIGSSESHAKYLEFLMSKHTNYFCKYVHIMDFYEDSFKPKGTLIIYS